MITYIYFVKCPNCEDEHFDFFDEAKEFALGCLSQKPIITQTEVCRNDFGECTDSADLGTVWSWEDMMGEGGYTEAEPTKSIFTKDDLKLMADGKDPEFDNLDNSVDCKVEEPETSEVSPIERKPIPEGMTIEELVEEMEENEDTVECTWCEELFDKSECRKEVDLGWLCSRCEMAIKSRGETLTFREGNYWDFLDEEAKPKTWICAFEGKEIGTVAAATEEAAAEKMQRKYPEYPYGLYDGCFEVYPADEEDITENLNEELSFSEMVADSINHLINDLGKDSSADDFADLVIRDIEDNYDVEIPEDPEKYRDWASAVASEVSRQLNNQPQLDEKLDLDFSNCVDSSDMEIWGVEPIGEATYKAVLMKRYENVSMRGYDESQKVYDEMYDVDGLFTFSFGKDTNPQLDAWNVHLLNKLGQCEIIFDDERYDQACEKALNGHSSKLEDFDPEELHDLGNEYDGAYPTENPELPEEDEIQEVSDSHLKLCPECGKETFDIETGICVECGFN